MSFDSTSMTGVDSDPVVLEPLLDAALAALDLAPTHCSVRDDGCLAYHRLWPWLRVLGLGSAPERHAQFFATHLSAGRRSDRSTRVLISGCADQSMLAHVVASIRPVEVTVVDVCRTPLELCARFAAGHDDVAIELVEGDVRALDAEPFDIVCTHSFLSQFRGEERPGLVAAWKRLTGDDGRVVTSTRLDPTGAGGSFDPAASAAFVERVGRAAAADDRPAVCDVADTLQSIAAQYARSLRVHSVASTNELEDLFGAAGFTRVDITTRTIGGESPGSSGPGIRQAADYAEVVASP